MSSKVVVYKGVIIWIDTCNLYKKSRNQSNISANFTYGITSLTIMSIIFIDLVAGQGIIDFILKTSPKTAKKLCNWQTLYMLQSLEKLKL